MKLPESQAKALEEASTKNYLEYGDWMELPQEEMESAFIDGSHYQAPISYAQAIKDVMKFLDCHEWLNDSGAVEEIEEHFSTELKSLENERKK